MNERTNKRTNERLDRTGDLFFYRSLWSWRIPTKERTNNNTAGLHPSIASLSKKILDPLSRQHQPPAAPRASSRVQTDFTFDFTIAYKTEITHKPHQRYTSTTPRIPDDTSDWLTDWLTDDTTTLRYPTPPSAVCRLVLVKPVPAAVWLHVLYTILLYDTIRYDTQYLSTVSIRLVIHSSVVHVHVDVARPLWFDSHIRIPPGLLAPPPPPPPLAPPFLSFGV